MTDTQPTPSTPPPLALLPTRQRRAEPSAWRFLEETAREYLDLLRAAAERLLTAGAAGR